MKPQGGDYWWAALRDLQSDQHPSRINRRAFSGCTTWSRFGANALIRWCYGGTAVQFQRAVFTGHGGEFDLMDQIDVVHDNVCKAKAIFRQTSQRDQ